jgi:hypothetical protein
VIAAAVWDLRARGRERLVAAALGAGVSRPVGAKGEAAGGGRRVSA